MQLNKIINTDKPNIKYLWFMFLPILVVVVIQYSVIIGDVIFLFIKNILSSKEVARDASIEFIMNSDFKQPMNKAYMTLIQYLIYILVFGLWYYKAFCKPEIMVNTKNSKANNAADNSYLKTTLGYMRDKLLTIKTIYLVIAGYMAQLMVDGILTLVEPYFKDLFANYGKMVDSLIGVSSSWVLLFAVIFVAPIGEELVFRGVIQHYGFKNFAPAFAIGLQGLIFGLYHGNIIQGIYAFFMGVVLGFVAHKLGSIIYSMVLHISVNASLLLVPEVLYDTTPRTIITTIISGIAFAGMIWLTVNNKSKNKKDSSPQS